MKKRIKRTTPVACGASDKGNRVIGLDVLALVIVLGLLFLLGCYQCIRLLPEVSGPPNFQDHMGENLNLAVGDEHIGFGDMTVLHGDEIKKDANLSAAQKSPSLTLDHDTTQMVVVPTAKWPVTIRDEKQEDWNTIIHPGDKKTEMLLPKFWSGPVHNNKLMTRELAMKIGSCIEPDHNGNFARGDDCPIEKRTIYVGIASYRDYQCRATAESIFLRAKHPERVRIGVVDQIKQGVDPVCNSPMEPCDTNPNQGLCKYHDQIDVFIMESKWSLGPVFARHVGSRLYRGEYYATQSDAHVTYTQDWDMDIIAQIESTRNEMAVLSTYLTDVQGSIDEKGKSLRKSRPIMCNTVYQGQSTTSILRHDAQPEREPSIHGMPQLQPWWAAGYTFSRGHFVVNVPYDWLQPVVFHGEEMSIGIRGFTVGYDFYAPERSVCFHHYATGNNAAVRGRVPQFTENWLPQGAAEKSIHRLLGIVHMSPEVSPSEWDHTDEHIYGIGGARSPEKFYEVFGIDVVKKTIQNHLCKFVDVGGKMHLTFTPFLRKDGMGIDYSKINYHFVDPML